MAWTQGQKTKNSYLWMAEQDILAFSDLLLANMPEIIFKPYFSHKESEDDYYNNPPTSVSSLHDILTKDILKNDQYTNKFISQAFTVLPTNHSWGILLFNYNKLYPNHICPSTDFNPYIDTTAYPEEFFSVQASSLGIRWNISDQKNDPHLCALMDQQIKQIWKLLNIVTKPVKCHELITGATRSSPNYRIGKQMYELVKKHYWYIQQGQFYVIE
ncbi:unnamed protein product [Commensalibacter communis]|uniref:Uncharacterized protein n=1 Tax=Commensalibacter communis TaxID=2972786 RepID=A0A9W4TPQ5_9PROT|nr:hypothetical protein [Commensalibacter communis]CAI3922621.1 unnamed protein product [Commensalibacter communis]CAI3944233.1 unnamed protein product [Commensalibacter communis]CAI3950283.1 unnamed protein product [Commensalibacter communis]CAI3951937.1 unnamed protein product [Commensalibacter communis]